MNKIILSIIVIFLLPISVFGFDWTVTYDMKQSDGSYEYLELSVPRKIKLFWTLPNQGGSWICQLSRYEDNNYGTSEVTLHCCLKKDERFILTSVIGCNRGDTKKNSMSVLYPQNDTNPKNIPTVVRLQCEL